MTTAEIVNKLWNLCNVLRDEGVTYHQYVSELTYLLFLKMAEETNRESQMGLPESCRWNSFKAEDGIDLLNHYRKALVELGAEPAGPLVRQIYANAQTSIKTPNNLKTIFDTIDQLDWFSAKEDGLGDLYEGLLEKNATETKSGAGQYFTPRPLINVMVRLADPKLGERCNDPSAGTFGFMIAASEYVRKQNDYFSLSTQAARFQTQEAFTGIELVPDTHRLALMNALLHGLEGGVVLGNTLSSLGAGSRFKNYDLVLANPPFGTKKGGETASREDFTFPSSNKQLNFLQHIYRSLKKGGRAAVVLPDNVLFQDGDGQKIRADLMDKCNLHTILRLPTGIFYAQGVKTNVLFFRRGQTDHQETKGVWFYDLRTNMPKFGKRTPLRESHFTDFEKAYTAKDRQAITDERLSYFSRQAILDKNDSLDLGLIPDENLLNYEDLPEPEVLIQESLSLLQEAQASLKDILEQL